MPKGRPSSYKPEYDQQILALMSAGFSLTAAAAEIGFPRQTLYEWEKVHESFAEAVALARGKRVLHLERGLFKAITGPQVTAHIFALKNADPHEWREKVITEHTGKDGGAIVMEHAGALADLDAEERKMIRNIIASRQAAVPAE